jgi:cell division GTPase FtsZ
MSWLKRKLFRKKISVAVIGIGNAGCKIGDKIIHQLRESNITVKSLAINYTDNFEPKIKYFADNFWFGSKDNLSSNSILEDAWNEIQEKEMNLRSKLEDVVFYKKGDRRTEEDLALHLIVGSGGGTGSAGTMIASNLILDITGDAPTIIYIVPERDEKSLVQYNAATALHFLGFSSKGPQSPILLFDNEKLMKILKEEKMDEVLDLSNNMLAEILTTTILAALQESTHEEYNADLNDFFSSFTKEARGLGVIVSVDKEFETQEKAQNVRFSDIFFNELDESSSLSADVTRAKRGYLTINMPTTYQSTFETRKIVKRFEKGSIKVALNSIEEPILTIRGVLTGIHPDYVDRFWEILEKGRDSRNDVITKEEKIRQSKVNLSH